MLQRSPGGNWLCLTPAVIGAEIDVETTRQMSGRGITAIENSQRRIASRAMVARFSGNQGRRFASDLSDSDLMVIAQQFFPNENIVGIQRL